MKKERKENVWRSSGIKERDIDNVFHEWEDLPHAFILGIPEKT